MEYNKNNTTHRREGNKMDDSKIITMLNEFVFGGFERLIEEKIIRLATTALINQINTRYFEKVAELNSTPVE